LNVKNKYLWSNMATFLCYATCHEKWMFMQPEKLAPLRQGLF